MRHSFILTIIACLIGCTPNEPVRSDMKETLEKEIAGILAAYPAAIVGISVRDTQTGLVYDKGAERSFHAASTMKIPVMIEVFRQSALGRFAMEDELEVINSFHSIVDSSLYSIEDDSDDAIYTKLGQRMSIKDLVYQMITVSSNLATNLLIDFVSADSAQATAVALGIKKMKVLRGVEDLKAFELGMSNTTTAADLAILLEALRDGEAVSPEADAQMIEVLKAQAFNEMIPVGLPAGASVAHKTGQITAIHHDAGIVYPANEAPYVLVLLIEGIRDEAISSKLGAALTRAIHTTLRG